MSCQHCNGTGQIFLPDYRVRCECPAGRALAKLETEVHGSHSRRIVPRWEERRTEYLRDLGREETPLSVPRKLPQLTPHQYVKERVWDPNYRKSS
jgi:hypothetical protein